VGDGGIGGEVKREEGGMEAGEAYKSI